MTIGFIGLGNMGSGMAKVLAASGEDLVVFDSVDAAMAAIVAEGAVAAESVADLTERADVIFLSLPGPAQIETVVFGPGGVKENCRAGQTLFDLSTSSVTLVRRVHDELAALGVRVLDAPVSGGPAGAASGALTLWVGGDKQVYDQHLQLLEILGSQLRHVGPIGSGTVTKLAHNMMGYLILQSFGEVFSVAVKAGMDPLDLWEAMRLGLVGRGSALDMLVNQFLPGTYDPPAFALKLAHKDVSLATAMGKELGVPMRLSNMTLEEMTEAVGRGFGEQDSRSYLKLQLERAGVDVAVDPERLRVAVEALRKQ